MPASREIDQQIGIVEKTDDRMHVKCQGCGLGA